MNIFEEILEKKKLPSNGLCNSIGIFKNRANNLKEFEVFRLMIPTQKDLLELSISGWYSTIYWGSGLKIFGSKQEERERKITPLRQTILMLCNEIYKEQYDKKRKKKGLLRNS